MKQLITLLIAITFLMNVSFAQDDPKPEEPKPEPPKQEEPEPEAPKQEEPKPFHYETRSELGAQRSPSGRKAKIMRFIGAKGIEFKMVLRAKGFKPVIIVESEKKIELVRGKDGVIVLVIKGTGKFVYFIIMPEAADGEGEFYLEIDEVVNKPSDPF